MNRRAFIAGLGTAATVSLTLNVRSPVAQVNKKRALLGYLSTARQAEAAEGIKWLLDDLREQGYAEHRDFDIAYRFADRQYDRLEALGRELIDLNPDVIITPAGDRGVLAIKAATAQIPIISPTLGDPVRAGIISSFAKPGGNITGVSLIVEHLPQKQLQLAVEALPGISTYGLLINASSGDVAFLQQRETETASTELGVKVLPATVHVPDDLDAAFRRLKEGGAEAVIVSNDGMFVVQRQRIASLAAEARLPDLYSFRDGVIAGGLLSYGVNIRENFRKGAALVIKILEGASPAQMPVEFPSKLELVINLKTAKALSLTVPPSLLARADEVIE